MLKFQFQYENHLDGLTGPPSPAVISSVVINGSRVYVKWSAPRFNGHSPINAYKVCIKCGEHSKWSNSSFPSSQHSAAIPCHGQLDHVYIVVAAVNNHGEGESAVQQIHVEHPGVPTDTPYTTVPYRECALCVQVTVLVICFVL